MAIKYEDDSVRIGLLAAEEPPATRTGTRERADAIAATMPLLREQKGTWFRIAEYVVKSAASSAVTRARKVHPQVEFKAVTAKDGKGSLLYARWVGK